MANADHFERLKQGVEAWNAWRREERSVRPDLGSADLTGAQLSEANLSGANLSQADLRGANLRGADLRHVDFRHAKLSMSNLNDTHATKANFSEANLNGAQFRGAILWWAIFGKAILHRVSLSSSVLREANLNEADLSGADLQCATLVDATLDCANLTDAHLWETQRGGWSIKGVICQRAFWDRAGIESINYAEGEFERLFAERPRIVLRYAGGITPMDLISLPVVVERLQAEHADSVLQIRSVQNDAGGASVVITVEDLKDRGTEVFTVEFEKIRAELVTLCYTKFLSRSRVGPPPLLPA